MPAEAIKCAIVAKTFETIQLPLLFTDSEEIVVHEIRFRDLDG